VSTRVFICCGSGGVGKTTTSAALALRLAQRGERAIVVTIDPARRLADALGVAELGNTPAAVSLPEGTAGTLHAMMLDSKRTFDDVIRRFAAGEEAQERILRNHIYRHVSARLAGAHEYMAMEKLYELAAQGAWDVVVLDTPPTAHALDFLRAPDRLANLMDEGVMRWLVLPASRGGWRMIERGSEILAAILQRFLGERTIGDIAEFFAALQALWEGFRERSLQVRTLLHAPSTRFLLVTTPAPNARGEALQFLEILEAGGMPFGGFLVNRCALPLRAAGAVEFHDVPDPHWPPLHDALLALRERQRRLVASEEVALSELRGRAPQAPMWRIPDLPVDVHDLVGLGRVAEHLPDL
jgi:anion-transporting  ArsA/GET3 family ATPase